MGGVSVSAFHERGLRADVCRSAEPQGLVVKTQTRKESRHMKVMIHIGWDVHNDSIARSIAPSDSTEVRRWGVFGGTHEHVQRFIKQLQAAHPDATLRFCYEAGP